MYEVVSWLTALYILVWYMIKICNTNQRWLMKYVITHHDWNQLYKIWLLVLNSYFINLCIFKSEVVKTVQCLFQTMKTAIKNFKNFKNNYYQKWKVDICQRFTQQQVVKILTRDEKNEVCGKYSVPFIFVSILFPRYRVNHTSETTARNLL